MVEDQESNQEPSTEQPATPPASVSCPCGNTAGDIVISAEPNQQVGRVSCGTCGAWGVDFLIPRVKDQNAVGAAASKAWSEAPRS